MLPATLRRHAPLTLSLIAGLALWEVAGRSTSAAFMAPVSATLERLRELALSGELTNQLISSATLFPTLYNTIEGARSIRPELIEVARSFRSSEWALWREVMVPYTLSFTMTGVRQAVGRGLVGMVAAEFFLSSTGLGQLIMGASQNFDTAGVFAAILIIWILGVALTRLGFMLERRFAPWRE